MAKRAKTAKKKAAAAKRTKAAGRTRARSARPVRSRQAPAPPGRGVRPAPQPPATRSKLERVRMPAQRPPRADRPAADEGNAGKYVYCIIKAVESRSTTGTKVLWILLIVFFPLGGALLWLLFGRKN